jgi:HSP20 family protein
MLLTKLNSFNDLKDLNKNVYDLTSSILDLEADIDSSTFGFAPQMSTRECEFSYYIDVDLPGVNKKDIKIDLEDHMLRIFGERNFKDNIQEEDYSNIETPFGRFERDFTLPINVDVKKISARLTEGVLEVTLPKLENKEKSNHIARIPVK